MTHTALGNATVIWKCDTCGKDGRVTTDHDNAKRAELIALLAHDAVSPGCKGQADMRTEQ